MRSRLPGHGKIDLVSGHGVGIRGPEVSVRAERLEPTARKLVEKIGDPLRWIRGVFQLRAGRVRQVVLGPYTVSADRIAETAKQDVKIDGSKIRLG